jgi:glycosyltransferase involved in cell wall biosynthesis
LIKPLVSVCIPCFNAEKYLFETINCLISQDYENLEILIVDDNSTDSSFQIIEKLALKFDKIRYKKSVRKGAAAARNQAYDLSSGDFIIFFDADDLVEPKFISSQLQTLNFNIEDCVISSWGRFTKTKETFLLDSTSVCRDLSFYEWIIYYWSNTSNMTIPGRILIPRNVVDKSGGWDENLSLNDDFQFFTNIFSQVKTIKYNNEGRLFYRSNIDGLSTKTLSYESQLSNFKSINQASDIALSKFNDIKVKQACVNLFKNSFSIYIRSMQVYKDQQNKKLIRLD